MALTTDQFLADVVAVSTGGATRDAAFGSGRLIAPGLVLTSGHVVDYPTREAPARIWKVYPRKDGAWADPRECVLLWRGLGTLDLALLQITGNAKLAPALQPVFASYDLLEPIADVDAAGFPKAWFTPEGSRGYRVRGSLRIAGDDGAYTLSVPVADNPDDRHGWEGMSGAAVCHVGPGDKLYLLGVVQEVPGHFSGGQLEIVRLSRGFAAADFRDHLGVALGQEPHIVALPGARVGIEASSGLNLSEPMLEQLRLAISEVLSRTGNQAGEGQAGASLAAQHFVVRLEYFGCLIYDRANSDYIPFDAEATQVFQLAKTEPREKVFELVKTIPDKKSLDTFYKLCQSIGLFDVRGRFTGVFLPNPAVDGVLAAPTLLHLAVTNACNFRCDHCFASSGQPFADELTTFEVKRLIDDLAAMGCFKIKFGGGEPLVRRDLPELIRHANDCGVEVLISTNAAAATKEVVNSLAGLRIAEFMVSMDGSSAELYDAVRGEAGAFRQAMAGIANLRRLQAPISLRRVLMRSNAADSADLIRLAEELDVKAVVLHLVMPVGRAASRPNLLLSPDETNHAWQDALSMTNAQGGHVRIPHAIPPTGWKRFFTGFGCECGKLECYIDARGEVAPSGLLKGHLSAGNVRRQSFGEIWIKGAGFTNMRGLAGNKYCRQCSHFRSCGGGCRASGVLMGHDVNGPDANCLIAADAGWRPG